MAATFLQAMVAAYGAIDDVPDLWAEQIADTVTSYPRAELNHMGEVPVYSQDGTVEMTNARCQVCVWDTTLAGVETLALAIREGLTPTSLTIDGFGNRLWRTNYRAMIDMERTETQKPIFAGVIEYHCEIAGGN